MRKFAVIVKFAGDVDLKKYDQLFNIGNGLYKFFINGNKRSSEKSLIKQINKLSFEKCRIIEVVDIIEVV